MWTSAHRPKASADARSGVIAHKGKLNGERKLQLLAGLQLSLDSEAFTACMNSDTAADRLQQDRDLGQKLEITGTPSLFLRGVCGDSEWNKVSGGPDVLKEMIDTHRAGGDVTAFCAE